MNEHVYLHPKGPIPYLEGGKGKTLLFLHGAFGTPHAYVPLLELLSLTYHVIAPTHPGHGSSFHISPLWKYMDYIDVYLQFIAEKKLTPFVIVGHSFGGAFALSLSDRLKTVRTVGIDAAGLPFPFIVKDFLAALVKEGRDAFAEDPDLQTVQELSRAAKSLAITFSKHPENIPWFYRHGPTLDLSHMLRTLTTPVSLLWGESDTIVPLLVGQQMQKIIPNATLTTFAGLKHDYAVTQPEFTHDQIMTVLSLQPF
jgi:pimeloyl-ACP methyl ester carboxylesterase